MRMQHKSHECRACAVACARPSGPTYASTPKALDHGQGPSTASSRDQIMVGSGGKARKHRVVSPLGVYHHPPRRGSGLQGLRCVFKSSRVKTCAHAYISSRSTRCGHLLRTSRSVSCAPLPRQEYSSGAHAWHGAFTSRSTRARTRTDTCRNACTYTHAHMHTRTQYRTDIHAHTQCHTTCAHAQIDTETSVTQVHTQSRIYTRTCTHA